MEFLKTFTAELTISSPGRINFIGEHTDYNMGYVLPTAIEKNIVFEFQKNDSDTHCHIYTYGYDVGFSLELNTIKPSENVWENYILGVVNEISKRTDKLRGFNCTIKSSLPMGSGLSSSAAMECGLAFGLNELFGLGLSKKDIVVLAQQAEHNYVGTQCGIMDQFASVMSEEGQMILLDCQSLNYQHIPFNIDPYKIVLLNTRVAHSLASSEYNTRKQECEQGVALLKSKQKHISSLRDVTQTMLDASKSNMSETIYNRCSFIIDENKRVLEIAEAFNNNDLETIGKLLYEAHQGVSTLYEVSCPESDFLVNFSKENKNVLGARQTGGGFGGCILTLVHQEGVNQFIENASIAYKKEFNIELEAFEVTPSGGTAVL